MARMSLTLAILAGGRSSRMGTDKAWVTVQGRPLITHILEQLRPACAETIIITNRPEAYAGLELPLFGDVWPEVGALGGLYSALHYATQPHVVCVACDMPYIVPALFDYLLSLRHTADVVLPRVAGEAEPFRAIYHRAQCLPAIHTALTNQQRRLISFLPHVQVREVPDAEWQRFDPAGVSFANLNTPEELARFEGAEASRPVDKETGKRGNR